ncbi:MAG TPA: hypothetical protein VEH29_15560 [Acidimicrobiales bacterium]|nr:hypothetical protein [Acidimicrobiales bacterium]
MEGDSRSFRIALTADRHVNPAAGDIDGLAVLTEAGWGVMQLPAEDYPVELGASLLREVAEQVEEFSRRGYDVVLVGERLGLAEALAAVGMPLPDQILPATGDDLRAFLAARPAPEASRLLG